MDALILAAGYSKRLEPLTLTCAKPLLPVAGRPMVDYLVDKLRAVPALRTIHLVSNAKFFNDFAAWGRKHGVTVTNDGTRSNDERLGPIRDLDLVIRERSLRDDLLVLAGDNLFDAALTDFVGEAAGRAPRVGIGVVDLQDRDLIRKRYGVVERADDGRVTAFYEKPEDPPTTLVSTGVYYFPKAQVGRVGTYLATGGNPENTGNLITWLVADPGVHAAQLPGRWFDIGDLASYEQANRTFQQ